MVLDTLYETGISKTDVIDSCDEWDYSSNVIISQKRAKKTTLVILFFDI